MQGELSEEPFWSRRVAWPWRLLGWAVLSALVLSLHWHGFESEDVTWLLLAADRLSHGGRWGVDILENNTPGAVLLYLPPAVAAQWLPIAPIQACIVWVILILIGCSRVAARAFALVCSRAPDSPQAIAAGFVTFGVLAFGSGNFALPMFGLGNHLGQRDPLIAGLLLPIAWLMLWREFRPEHCRALHRLAIAMAAIALCIKPQFALPLAIWFAVACYRHGWRDALRRMGFGWMAAAGLAYLALVLLVFPEWLATARLTAQTYGAYSGTWVQVGFASIPAVLLLTIAARVLPQSGAAEPLLRAALIAGASYFLLALIERKGWFYHQLPAVLTLLVALGLAIVARRGCRSGPTALALAAILPGLLLLTAWRTHSGLTAAYEREPLVQALHRTVAPDDPWAVISVTSLPAFPTTAIEGYRWILRRPSLWPLPGAVAMLHDGRAETGAAIKTAVAQDLADDLEKGRPKLIVIDHDPSTDLLPQDDLLPLLLQTPRFAAVWSGYRFAGAAEHFDLYVPRD